MQKYVCVQCGPTRKFGAMLLVVSSLAAILSACEAPHGAHALPVALASPQEGTETPTPISPLPASLPLDSSVVQLGKSLFHDRRLSRDDHTACTSCHRLRDGGDDGQRVSVGSNGREGVLNTPTVLNAGFDFIQSWDGRAGTLESEIIATIRNPVELNTDLDTIRRKLDRDPALVSKFQEAFDDGLTDQSIVEALSTYVRALITPMSPFDRYLSGDSAAISSEAHHGYLLFQRFGCVSCHQGRNVGGNLFERMGVMANYFGDHRKPTRADYGRFNVTGRERDRYEFKVPSLRNVAQTAPYFHDGSAATLQQAIQTMAKYQLGRPVTHEQTRALIAFLNSLSGHLDKSLL